MNGVLRTEWKEQRSGGPNLVFALFSLLFSSKAKSKSAGFGVQYWSGGASLIPAEPARSVDECQQVTGQDLG
jgi:hypothetical protein